MFSPSVNEIKKWNRKAVIEFLQEKRNELDLDERDIEIIENNRVTGLAFLLLTEKKLLDPPYNMPGGPATVIAELVKSLNAEDPPETVESLRKYERYMSFGQSQKFLDIMGQDFKWPASMPEYHRGAVFWGIINENGFDFNVEVSRNYLFLHKSLDEGMFIGNEDKWVLVDKQSILSIGTEYTNEELVELSETRPGAIYLPVDPANREDSPIKPIRTHRAKNGDYMAKVRVKSIGEADEKSVVLEYMFIDPINEKEYMSCLDTGSPYTVLPYDVRRKIVKGWSRNRIPVSGYGSPANVIRALLPFEVSIGDGKSWSKWVVTGALRIWEENPGDTVGHFLIGSDVLDKVAYVHEPNKSPMFLKEEHEILLTAFNIFLGSLP